MAHRARVPRFLVGQFLVLAVINKATRSVAVVMLVVAGLFVVPLVGMTAHDLVHTDVSTN